MLLSLRDAAYGILGLAAYQALRALAHSIFRSYMPAFYNTLRKSEAFQLRAYLVFPIGFLITILTTPFCLAALSSSSSTSTSDTSPSTPYFVRNLSTSEKICLGSRSVLWISEMPLLRHSSQYMIHHILSLSSLGTVLLTDLTLRPLYLIYAGLITEIFSDSIAILRFHGFNQLNSEIYAALTLVNAMSLMLLRMLPAILFTYAELRSTEGLSSNAYMASVLFYAGWLLWISYKQLSGLGYIELVWTRPVYVRIGSNISITIFSLLLGTAMVASQIASVVFYTLAHDGPVSDNEVRGLAITGVGTVVSGLLGAKLMNHWMLMVSKSKEQRHIALPGRCGVHHALRCSHSNPIITKDAKDTTRPSTVAMPRPQNCSLKGISIQGSLLFSALWVILSHNIAPSVDTRLLLASMALSFPLGEAIGRIGCYFGGCCGSKQGKDDNNNVTFPVQFISSGMNAVAFYVLGALVLEQHLHLFRAGILAITANAAFRLVLDPLRHDATTTAATANPTSLFALCQLILSTMLLIVIDISAGKAPVNTISVTSVIVVGSWLAREAWLRLWQILWPSLQTLLVYAPWLSRPITYSYTFSSIVVLAVLYDKLASSAAVITRAPVFNSSVQMVLSNQDWLSCAFVTFSVPVLAMSSFTFPQMSEKAL